MMTPYQHAKFARYFDLLDRNGNGSLERADFMADAAYIQDRMGWPGNHPDLRKIVEAKTAFWDAIRRYGSGDPPDAITRADWLKAFQIVAEEVNQTGNVPLWLRSLHKNILASIDLNHDGHIGIEEYEIYLGSIGCTADAREVFDELDLDGNGQLDLEEVEEIVAAFLLSDDPEDVANDFILGPSAD